MMETEKTNTPSVTACDYPEGAKLDAENRRTRPTTAEDATARAQTARDARVDTARRDGGALLEAKMRVGGDPTKADVVNGILQALAVGERLFEAVNQHAEASNVVARVMADLCGYAIRLSAWQSRPWWRRRRRDRPGLPASAVEMWRQATKG